MFERFTERARQVLVLANDEARNLGHDYIGTEHLLLGLLREEEGIAASILIDGFSITVGGVRDQMLPGAHNATDYHLPYTSRAKQVLDLSLREALALGHNYIGTEHVLLGLLREGEGQGIKILRSFTEPNDVREAVVERLTKKPEIRSTRISNSYLKIIEESREQELQAITEDIAAAVERGVLEGLRRALSRLNLS